MSKSHIINEDHPDSPSLIQLVAIIKQFGWVIAMEKGTTTRGLIIGSKEYIDEVLGESPEHMTLD